MNLLSSNLDFNISGNNLVRLTGVHTMFYRKVRRKVSQSYLLNTPYIARHCLKHCVTLRLNK